MGAGGEMQRKKPECQAASPHNVFNDSLVSEIALKDKKVATLPIMKGV